MHTLLSSTFRMNRGMGLLYACCAKRIQLETSVFSFISISLQVQGSHRTFFQHIKYVGKIYIKYINV